MSLEYKVVGWTRHKKIYDLLLLAFVVTFVGLFVGLGAVLHPAVTAETLLIRAFGTLALFLLHVVLVIGPLCRLDARFLPLLYNRRHLGVTTFVIALAHGVFSLVQFHALGDVNPLVSMLATNTRFDSISQFPFHWLGAVALVILFLMAATSHDFWLHNLSAALWKRLHMAVYFAYTFVVAHVALGALQTEMNLLLAAFLCAGVLLVVTLHLLAGRRETRKDAAIPDNVSQDGFIEACPLQAIPEGRAKVVSFGAERIAIFKHNQRPAALSNICRHQGGPLGEGQIIGGCVTCPWHGYQYVPETGASPPPFQEKVSTYRTRVIDGVVWVHPDPVLPGSENPTKDSLWTKTST